MITVVNKKFHKGNGEYIGRPSCLGNPFTHKPLKDTKALYKCNSIEEAVLKYKEWLEDKLKNKDTQICSEMNRLFLLAKKGDLVLICWCITKDNPYCHGNVIKEILEKKL